MFDPSALVNPLALYRGDGVFTSFNYLDFPVGGGALYLQNTNGGGAQPWNGATRCTWAFTVLLPSSDAAALYTLLANEDGAGNNECFSLQRATPPNDSGFGSPLRVNIAASLSDRGVTYGDFGNTLLDGRMSHFTTPVALNGTKTPQRGYCVVVVFDGTLTGNSNRLKCYLNGVLDPAPVFGGTIPAHLTSPAAGTPLTLGYGLWQGSRMGGGIHNVAIWPGVAFTGAQAAAYCQVARSSWPVYKTRAQLLAFGVPTGDSNWYACNEASTGAGAVNRLDSSGNGRTMTEVGGFVASNTALQWVESFAGDVAQSVTYCAPAAVTNPVVVAGDTPSGKAALRFPLGANSNGGLGTINQMQMGAFGFAGGNWPAGYDLWLLVKKDDNRGNAFLSEQNFSGADSTNGQDGNSYGTNCFASNSSEDLGGGGFGGSPGSITTGAGNGLGDYNPTNPNSHPGINFAVTRTNVYTAGTYFVLNEGFRPGVDVVSYIAVNGVTLPTRNQGEDPTFPVPPKNFEDIAATNGKATCYCLGGTAGEWLFPSAALQGNIALFCLVGPGNSDADRLRMDVWTALYGGFTPPTPNAPTGLVGTSVGGVNTLSWSAPAQALGVNGYVIYRNGSPVTTVVGTTFTDSFAAPNTQNIYSVTAAIVTTVGNSESAHTSSVSLPGPSFPAAPGGVDYLQDNLLGAGPVELNSVIRGVPKPPQPDGGLPGVVLPGQSNENVRYLRGDARSP